MMPCVYPFLFLYFIFFNFWKGYFLSLSLSLSQLSDFCGLSPQYLSFSKPVTLAYAICLFQQSHNLLTCIQCNELFIQCNERENRNGFTDIPSEQESQ